MSIHKLLSQISAYASRQQWDELESHFHEVCRDLAGVRSATRIAGISTKAYEGALRRAAKKASVQAEKFGSQGVYFEFDLDNGWESSFFLCADYDPDDEEWTLEDEHVCKGPRFAQFAQLYDSRFDDTKCARGVNAYLVARTVAIFGRITAEVSWGHAALCMAFHDQSPIICVRQADPHATPARRPNSGEYFEINWPERCESVAEVVEDIDPLLTPNQVKKKGMNVSFVIRDGDFRDYQQNNQIWPLCSERMRRIVDAGRAPGDRLDWFPVTVRRHRSNREYFVPLFSRIGPLNRILDMRQTKFIEDDYVVVPVLRRSTAKKHQVLTYEVGSITWIVSDTIRKELAKAKCTGVKFRPICVSEE